MIQSIKKMGTAACLLAVMSLFLTSCYEEHYYHRYHHHTRDWYDRHHTPPPAGVNFDVDVHN